MANANWSNPTLTSTYTNFVTEVKNRDEDLALQFDGTTSTNIPTNTIRWDSSANRWKKWNGTSWAELTSTYALTALSTTGNASIGGIASVPAGSATAASLAVGTGTTYAPGIYSPGADQLALATGGSGRLYINSSGQVGVGDSSPTARLVCNGAIQVTGTGTPSAGAGLEISYGQISASRTSMQSYNRTGSAYLGADYDALDYRFYTSGGEKLRITSGGLVGIGTSSPSDYLHISGSAGNTAAVRLQANDGRSYLIGSTGSGYGSANNFIIYDATAGAERFRITSGGNVGIGTTPSELLHVSGGLVRLEDGASGSVIRFYKSSAQTAFIANRSFGFHDGNGLALQTSTADPIRFAINDSEAVRIDSSKRLLVGTSTSTNNIRFNQKLSIVQAGADTVTGISVVSYSGANSQDAPSVFDLCRSRGSTDGSMTVVGNGDSVGEINFRGSDGTNFVTAAQIKAWTDGGIGTNDMPGRLVFSTTADGASSPTERVRLDNLGYLTGTVNGLGKGNYACEQYYRLNAALAGSNVNTAQSILGVGVTLVASTVYEFEGVFALSKTTGTTSHTISLGFGGTATLNNIAFEVTTAIAPSGLTTGGTASMYVFQTAGGGAVDAAQTSAGMHFMALVKGTVSINAGGTLVPQYTLSAAPGGAYSTVLGSYFKIAPLGASGANTSIGTWA